MGLQKSILAQELQIRSNGSAAAAVLACGIGSILLAIFTVAADKSAALKGLLTIYKPAGPLSGVTTAAILGWLVVWVLLEVSWRRKEVSLTRVDVIAFVLLALSLLATFPPIGDLL
jgi:hypothetical protein